MAATPATTNVFAGAPDRATGAVLSAVAGTALPTSIATAPAAGFLDYGYISEDGLSMTQDVAWEKIKEWGADTVRRILSDFSGSFSWTFIETNALVAKAFFGETNVTVTAKTVSTGTLLAIKGNAIEPAPRAWVFRMVDGVRKIMICVPLGQVTDRGDVAFTKTGAVTFPVTLECIPDATGNSFYIYTDDGVYGP